MIYPPKNPAGVVVRWLARALSVLIILIYLLFVIQNLSKGNIQSKDLIAAIIELLAIGGLIYSFFDEKIGSICGFVLGTIFLVYDRSYNFYYFFIPVTCIIFYGSFLLSKYKEDAL